MGKLIESTFVTLDGVISAPDKWGAPYWDGEHSNYAQDLLFAADALLLGRKTYQGFAATWPERTAESQEGRDWKQDSAHDSYSDRINRLPKYVASRTLTDDTLSGWNTQLIHGDPAAEIAKIKERHEGNILKFGTGELDQTLLTHNLVDEFRFWVFPVLAGGGVHLLEDVDGFDITHLELQEVTRFASGIAVMTYTPTRRK
jgi:dihydrofolate reductase